MLNGCCCWWVETRRDKIDNNSQELKFHFKLINFFHRKISASPSDQGQTINIREWFLSLTHIQFSRRHDEKGENDSRRKIVSNFHGNDCWRLTDKWMSWWERCVGVKSMKLDNLNSQTCADMLHWEARRENYFTPRLAQLYPAHLRLRKRSVCAFNKHFRADDGRSRHFFYNIYLDKIENECAGAALMLLRR